ncbi:MAG: DUF11 domain-containing protein [Chloroflexi bacterium]|nr:DUF11 domain-containing protein [Chloroflexota bacterium]
MKRKFALTASVLAALLIVGTVLILTSLPTQAASISNKDMDRAVLSAPSDNTYQSLPFSQNWSITTAISVNDNWSGVSGIIGYLGDYTTSSPTGVDPQTLISDTVGSSIDVIANQSTPNTNTAGGVGEFDGIADPVVALQGSGTADAPHIVLYINTTGLENITVSYNVRDIDGAVDNAVQPVALHYRVGSTGNFTNLPGGYIADATTGPSLATLVTPVTVTLPANADNQPQVQLRIMTTNAAGSDEWVGIDTIAVTGITLPPEADLGLSKDGPATALASETITYTISLSNTGTAEATGTLITDTLPTEVTFVTYTTALPVNSFSQNGQDLIWDLGDVPTTTVNAAIGVQVVISPLPNGSAFTNTVTAATTYTESNQTDNTDSVMTFIGAPDLAIVKTGPDNVNAGETFTYTLAYSNAGSIEANDVAIVDQLPAGVAFVTETTASAVVANGQLTWTLGTLAASAGSSIEVVVTADQAGEWVNTATIGGGPIDSDLLNNTASVTTTVLGADPFVLKSGPAAAFIDRQVLYTLTYGNHGNITATATVTDQLPAGFSVADIATDNSNLPFVDGGATRAWTVDIAPNSAVSFTLALTVPTAIAPTTLITNGLTISAIEAGDDPLDNAASATSTVYEIVSIATARAGAVGEVFGVEGSVTYVPGTYNASGWGLQDGSGGIAVFYTPAPSVHLGDRVQLVATRNASGSEKQLSSPMYYFANLEPDSPVIPGPFTTGNAATGAAEGWLAVISGTVSNLSTCTNSTFNVDDGTGPATVYVDIDTALNLCNLGIANGDVVRFAGFGTLFGTLYEIKPRQLSDVAEYPRVLDVAPLNNSTGVTITTQVTATFNLTLTNVTSATFTVADSAGAVPGTVGYDPATRTATFTPDEDLALGTRYTVTLKSTLAADNGLTLMPAQDYVWSFVTYQPTPQLSFAKSFVDKPAGEMQLGEVVTYTLGLSNSGDGVATGVLITDALPVEVTFGGFVQQGGAAHAGGTVTWSGSLNAGITATVIFTATVGDQREYYGRTVTNIAQFTSDNGGGDSAEAEFQIVKRYFLFAPIVRR